MQTCGDPHARVSFPPPGCHPVRACWNTALAHPDEESYRGRDLFLIQGLTDQDDDDKESEYCLSISITHPSGATSVICRDVDWDQDVPSAYADDDDDDAGNEEDIEELADRSLRCHGRAAQRGHAPQ